MRRLCDTDHPHDCGEDEPEQDCLNRSFGGALHIFFASSTGNKRRRSDAQPDRNAENQCEQGFGEADSCHRV